MLWSFVESKKKGPGFWFKIADKLMNVAAGFTQADKDKIAALLKNDHIYIEQLDKVLGQEE